MCFWASRDAPSAPTLTESQAADCWKHGITPVPQLFYEQPQANDSGNNLETVFFSDDSHLLLVLKEYFSKFPKLVCFLVKKMWALAKEKKKKPSSNEGCGVTVNANRSAPLSVLQSAMIWLQLRGLCRFHCCHCLCEAWRQTSKTKTSIYLKHTLHQEFHLVGFGLAKATTV